MTEFENVKNAFLWGSVWLLIFGAFYIFLGLLGMNIAGLGVSLAVVFGLVIIFDRYRKKYNPLYQLDYASRKNIIKKYYLFEPKTWMRFASFAVIGIFVGGTYLLGQNFRQAVLIGLGFPVFIWGLISLVFTLKMKA